MKIPAPDPQEDIQFMRLAIEQAHRAAEHDEVPIGAVVVYRPYNRETRRYQAPPQIIATGFNLRETLADPSAHAEFRALRDASQELARWRLNFCTVYVTLEPCIMCAGLMHQARVDRCVFGAPDPKAGALGTLYQINEDPRLNHRFEVTGGVLEDECAQLLKDFFRKKRA